MRGGEEDRGKEKEKKKGKKEKTEKNKEEKELVVVPTCPASLR